MPLAPLICDREIMNLIFLDLTHDFRNVGAWSNKISGYDPMKILEKADARGESKAHYQRDLRKQEFFNGYPSNGKGETRVKCTA